MLVTLSGIITPFNLVIPEKAPTITLVPLVILPTNDFGDACFATSLITSLELLILVISLHPPKASLPMLVTLSPIVTLVKLSQ